MKTFKTFLTELSLDKNHSSIFSDNALHELNKNLSISLSDGFGSVDEAVAKVRKILRMYGIELPNIKVKNDPQGSFIIPLNVYQTSGDVLVTDGPDVVKPFGEKNDNYKLTFAYEFTGGRYNVSVEVAEN